MFLLSYRFVNELLSTPLGQNREGCYQLCKDHVEDVAHICFGCGVSGLLWYLDAMLLLVGSENNSSLKVCNSPIAP